MRNVGARVSLAAVVLAAGCGAQTGILLEVEGPEGASSVTAGVTTLAFVASRESWCERQVADATASATRVDVRGRDLGAQPYSLLVKPARVTDLEQPVRLTALALGDGGRLVGVADFGAHPFELKRVNRFRERIVLTRVDAPVVSTDGCLCAPGLPRVGNGSRTGCDLDVVPSRARWSDTAGCELGPMNQQLAQPVCDGQDWGDDANRELPCVSTKSGACRLAARVCRDRDGIGFETACLPAADAPELPSALCDAYRACEANPCGDIQACFRARAPRRTEPLKCKLHLRAEQGTVTICDGERAAAVSTMMGDSCPAALVDGRRAGPLLLSMGAPGEVVSSECPPRLLADEFDAQAAVGTNATEVRFDLLLGGELVEVRVTLARGCDANAPAFECFP